MNKAKFLNLVEEIAELDPGTLKGNEPLMELEGWDSLSVVAFIAAIDKHLGATPSPVQVASAQTVADLMASVQDKLFD